MSTVLAALATATLGCGSEAEITPPERRDTGSEALDANGADSTPADTERGGSDAGPADVDTEPGDTERSESDGGTDAPDGDPGPDCSDRRPSGLTRDPAIISGSSKPTTTFESVYREFGGANTHRLTIENGQYAALSLTTSSQTSSSLGTVSIIPDTVQPRGPMLVTISRCRGDFGPHLSDECRRLLPPYQQWGIAWAIEPSNPNQCDLELDTDYFFNIVPTVERPNDQEPQWACGENDAGMPKTSAPTCSVASTARER